MVLLLAGLLPVMAQAAPPAGYYLVWSDEFNGSSLDATKWNIETGARRQAVNSAAAVSMNGSNLVITTFTSGGKHYTGLIQTSGKFNPRYGYTEASIKWSDSPGMWSAYWMWVGTMTTVGDVSVNGAEMDVCEHRSQDNNAANINNQVQANIHWDGYGTDAKSTGSGNIGSGLGSGFHTYGLRWDASQYRVLIDGTQLYSTTQGHSDRSEYVILSSEVQGGSWAGSVPAGGYGDLASSTTKMTVDYVRFYAPTTTVYWAGAASADWSNSANWVAGRAPQPGDDVVFSYLSTNNRATMLPQRYSVGSLAFLETPGGVTLAGSPLTVGNDGIDVVSAVNDPTLNLPIVLGAAQTWKTRSGRTLVVNGAVSGSANLTLDGYGNVRLTAANSLAGKIVVNGGTLVITNQNELGPNPVVFTADKLTLNGGTLRSGESGSAANVILDDANRGLTLGANGGTVLTFFNTSLAINTPITGAGALTKGSVGTLTLGAANTFTGDTRVNDGMLILQHPNALQNSTVDMNTNDNGTLNLNNQNAVLGGLSGGRALSLAAGAVTVGNNNASTTYSGVLSGSGPLTKTGTGALTLTGANTFTGPLLASQGFLVVGNNNALGAATQPTIVANGAEVRFATPGLNVPESFTLVGAVNGLHAVGSAGGSVTLSGAVTLTGNSTMKVDGSAPALNLTGPVNLGSYTLTVALDGGMSSLGGGLNGTGGLLKTGAGTLRLDAANTFAGDTRIAGGAVSLADPDALQFSTVDLNAADAGALDLNNLNAVLGGLKGSRDLALGSGTVAIGNNAQSTTYAGTLSGNAAVTKIGAGTWTLTGNNPFAGGVMVAGGTLKLANVVGSATGPGAVVVQAGGTLTGNGSASGAVTVDGTLAPGDGVGSLTTGTQTWNGGGRYAWELNDASLGGDTLTVNGSLNVTATPANKFIVKLISLAGSAPGPAAGFDHQSAYTWTLANVTGSLSGFDPNAFAVDTSAFSNDLGGGAFTVEAAGNMVVLKFHPNTGAPEFTGGAAAEGAFELRAQGVPGKSYALQMATNFVPPVTWIPVTNLTADVHGEVRFTDPDSAGVAQRFYRLATP